MGWKIAIGVLLLAVTSFADEASSFKTLDKGGFSGIQQQLEVVVTNKNQWEELWGKHTAQKLPKPPAPEIDFDKQSIVFISLGRKNTGGYSVEITDIQRSGKKAEVLFSSKEPKPGGFTIQALTAPFHIVTTPRIEGEVKFRKVESKKGG
jgi:hypothetical protein